MKILVTLDGSRFSEAILDPVAKLARPLGATVELLSVERSAKMRSTPLNYGPRDTIPTAGATGTRLNIPTLDQVIPPPAESREQAVDRVDAEQHEYLMARAGELTGIETTVRFLMAGDPADAIIAHARDEGFDLIAMATHGRAGLSHLVAGSVCERVIRSGVAPVMVLRPTDRR